MVWTPMCFVIPINVNTIFIFPEAEIPSLNFHSGVRVSVEEDFELEAVLDIFDSNIVGAKFLQEVESGLWRNQLSRVLAEQQKCLMRGI